MVESYLKVFKEIFAKARHIEHYTMMMGETFVDESVAAVIPTAL